MRHVCTAWVFLVSCAVNAGYDDTSFKCSESEPCPGEQLCEGGRCVAEASTIDAGEFDDAAGFDASVDCVDAISLVDDFDDGVTSDSWNTFADTDVSVVEEDGLFKILFDPRMGAREGGYRTVDTFDFSGARVYVEVVEVADADTQRRARLAFGSNQNNGYYVEAQNGELQFGALVAGATQEQSIPYDADQHRWWQLREQDGQVVVETSTNGSSWQERGSFDTEGFASSSFLELGMFGRVRGETDSVHFDNLNRGDDCL